MTADELRPLLALLREHGVTEYEGDGLRLKLALVLAPPPAAKAAEPPDRPSDVTSWDDVKAMIPPPPDVRVG